MVLALPPEKEDRLRQICEQFSVEMTVIGTFEDDRRLHLTYEDRVVADVSMDFLHGGLPRRTLIGTWTAPAYEEPELAALAQNEDLGQALLRILAQPNVRSKEDVVRRYDHEVQGGTVIKPFVGPESDGPSDGVVLRPLEVADTWMGLAVGCGFNPAYGAIDPYAMAVSAIDEAVRNVVSVGGDPDRVAILDNFCWGNPLLPDRMGSLVRACKGCYAGALQYGAPFISGKDSLNNEYTDSATGRQVAIPPSLLISALSRIPDIRRTCTMDLKEAGNYLYVLGETRSELGGSYYYRLHDVVGSSVPEAAEAGLDTARALHRAMTKGLIRSCHDCSEGGLAVALAEMALGGGLGARIELGGLPVSADEAPHDAWLLYAESNGRYVVEVSPDDAEAFEELVSHVPHGSIGRVDDTHVLDIIGHEGRPILSVALEALEEAWRGHVEADADAAGECVS
jgi:phosphoribosylformylglycinamidine synthase